MPPTILHVEDDANDALLVRLALTRQKVDASIQHVVDGQQAIDYLQGAEAYSDRAKFPFPNLILLDLQLPKLDGFQVLSWMRRHMKERHVPTLVLTSSTWNFDQDMVAELGAAEFLTKQFNFPDLGSHVTRHLPRSPGDR